MIPVFLRSCDWKSSVFGILQGVPDDAKPISECDNRDRAFTAVAQAVRKAAESVSIAKSAKSPNGNSQQFSADFSKIRNFIDWDKVRAKVGEWAAEHKARNPYDMGPENYKKCLYDLGLPGGENVDLKHGTDGYMIYR